jgi:hypothetical protein
MQIHGTFHEDYLQITSLPRCSSNVLYSSLNNIHKKLFHKKQDAGHSQSDVIHMFMLAGQSHPSTELIQHQGNWSGMC